MEITVRDKNIKTLRSLKKVPVSRANRSIQYFDDFGRVIQTVGWQASPTGKDVVQLVDYDGFGRAHRTYLPYAEQLSNDGSYKITAGRNQKDYYDKDVGWDLDVVKTKYPYAEKKFENSPLNRVLEQGAAGQAWQLPVDRNTVTRASDAGHTVVMEQSSNGEADVSLWKVDHLGAIKDGWYLKGTLFKTVIKDENWVLEDGKGGNVEEYKDFDGKIIMKRVWESKVKKIETYYIYDNFGDLRYVIPAGFNSPRITDASDNVQFNELVYAYKYDGRRRLIKKKLPGKGWEYMVYNNNDQVVYSRDSEQLKRGEWSFVKYDAFGRVIMTGIEKGHSGDNQDSLILKLSAFRGSLWEDRTATLEGYTNNSLPQNQTNMTVLTVNYYDSYHGIPDMPFSDHNGYSDKVKGLLTASKTRVLKSLTWLWDVNHYDQKGRLVNVQSTNHLKGEDHVTNTYTFLGDLEKTQRIHKVRAKNDTITLSYGYDHIGRLLSTKHKINHQKEVVLVAHEYNEIGQLVRKQLEKDSNAPSVSRNVELTQYDVVSNGEVKNISAATRVVLKSGFHAQNGSSFSARIAEGNAVQDIQYTYNERGWLESQNSKLFGYTLSYIDGAKPQYNGNISEQKWRRTNSAFKKFTYEYDRLNRLIDGNSIDGNLREQLRYDMMGNIDTLIRDKESPIVYNYAVGAVKSNRLQSITGGMRGSYTYDLNGNAKTDRTGMTFGYNHLNLPDTISNSEVRVGYLYDALGKKLRKYSNQGGNKDYVNGIEYKADGTIDFIHTGEGIAVRNASNNTYSYRYNITDHLGNVRTTIYRNPTTNGVESLQEDDYYPFGKQSIVLGSTNKYLYNGKEKQEELGGQYDYGARLYDAEIGRWNVMDPLSEKYFNHSPYNYVLNNPIDIIDPNGKDIIILSYGKKSFGHKYGHIAMLIGNEKDGWTYYSKDGDSDGIIYDKNGKTYDNDRFTIEEFDHLSDFANSEHNTFKEDYDDVKYGKEPFQNSERDSEGRIRQRYEKATLFVTSKKEDAVMKETAKKTTATAYSTFLNNCIDNVESTLKVGGFKTGDGNGMDPSGKFGDIKKENKGSLDISVFLKPKNNEKKKN